MTFDAENSLPPGARIKVIGVGGGGGNAVNTMIQSNLDGVDFLVANTDVQSLRTAKAPTKIQLGKELTKGLGAGADPDIGREAALEDRHEIAEFLQDADMVFITAGMGGGTGTGAAAVISQIARELGALTVGVVTKPFDFEGKRRRRHAELGIERLKDCVDTLITIPNQKLLQIATPDLTMMDAFKMADNVLVNAVRGISDIINVPGTVNVDFADVKAVMSSMGHALMGIGVASGEKRAVEAARQAISSPLLEDIDIEGATGILINITASSNISLIEISEACSIIQEAAHEEANIIFGAAIDENLGEEIRVTVIATGFPMDQHHELQRVPEASTGHHRRAILNQPTTSTLHRASSAQTQRFSTERNDSLSHGIMDQNLRQAVEPQRHGAASSQNHSPFSGHQEADDLVKWTMEQTMEPSRQGGTTMPYSAESGLGSRDRQDWETGTHSLGMTERSENHSANTRPFETELDEIENRLLSDDYHSMDLEVRNANLNANIGFDEVASGKSEGPTAQSAQFQDDLFSKMHEDISMKIDHALDFAEKLHGNFHDPKISADDMEIPAFIRNGMKDIPIS